MEGDYPLSASAGGRTGAAAPGLESLALLDRLLVQQQLELWEAVTGWETSNRYTVRAAEDARGTGEPLYRVTERSNCCLRWCYGPLRPLRLSVQDERLRREVLQLTRPLRCQGGCCSCCQQRLDVLAADGRPLGWVLEQWACLRPQMEMYRADGQHVLTVGGPRCPLALCRDVRFPVVTANGDQEVACITKQWGGVAREVLTDADTLLLTFSVPLDTELKALLLGALFLVDYMFFERNR